METRYRHRPWGLARKRKNTAEFQYVVGQAITVLYDPLGEVPPRIDTWSALNGLSLALLSAGAVTCGTAVLLGVFFGANIVNGIRALIEF